MRLSSPISTRSAKPAVAPLLGFALCLTGFGLAGESASAETRKTKFASMAENSVPLGNNRPYQPLQPGHSQTFVVAMNESHDEKIKTIAVKVVPGKAVNLAVKKRLGADRYVVGVQSENDGGSEVDVIIDMKSLKVIAIDKHKVLAID